MEDLRRYLNALSVREQAAFAASCGTTLGYLRKAISAKQMLGEGLCARIEAASGGTVQRRVLRRDWKIVWPELA